MKKITMLFVAIMTLCFAACSSESEEVQTPSLQDDNELIIQGKAFANIHNACLESIYNSISSSKTRVVSTHEVLKSEIVSAANQYIANHIPQTSQTRSNTNVAYVNEDDYGMTIDDIRSQMSEYELVYIDKILSNNEDCSKIFEEIINDNNLTESKKQAVICFATTYKASSDYWQQNIEKWNRELKITPTTRAFSFNVKEVAFADAYWGYTGMLSSGLNLWVGGGAAAVGSAFACLQ